MSRRKNEVDRPRGNGSPTPARIEAQYFHSGPLPDPQTLERYDDIVPGAAERILVLAEKQAAHRQVVERRVVSTNAFAQILGLVLGGALVAIAIGAGTYLVVHDKDVQGLSALLAAILGPLAALFFGRQSKPK